MIPSVSTFEPLKPVSWGLARWFLSTGAGDSGEFSTLLRDHYYK